MKKGFIIFGLLVLLIGAAVVYFHSFEFSYQYYKGIDRGEGLDDSSISIVSPNSNYIMPPSYKYIENKSALSDVSQKWEKMHFQNLRLPLPVKHPMISIRPWIAQKKKGIKLGLKMVDSSGQEQLSFIQHSEETLNFDPIRHSLFNNPAFRRYLKLKSSEDIWSDVINKDLRLNLDEKDGFVSKAQFLLTLKPKELIYNLYILGLRKRLFPDENNVFGEDQKSGLFIVRKKGVRESPIIEEMIYIHHLGKIYKILLRANPFEVLSQSIREKVLNNMRFDKSDKDSSKFLMAEFKKLTFKEKSTEHGLLYLLSGWSHELDNKEFVKYTIRTLERGENNLSVLLPLYEYSYKKFRTNFSSIKSRLREDKEENVQEPLVKEIKKVPSMNLSNEEKPLDIEGKTKEEALKEVIKRKINIDEDEDVLSID
jgi:hypothetical protein